MINIKINKENIIITDDKNFNKIKKDKKIKKIKIFKFFKCFKKLFKTKIDYSMCSIMGIEGLEPTLNIIKHSKVVAIANKESIICGWNLLKKELKRNNTTFIPVDSEHFSIWFSLKDNYKTEDIKKIYNSIRWSF